MVHERHPSGITSIAPTRTGRWLKDLYPCRHCTKPVPVRNRREIEWASCEHCEERRTLLRRSTWAMERAVKKHKDNTGVHEHWPEIIPPMLEAAHMALEAASLLTRAALVEDDGRERAKWLRIARQWTEWGRGLSAKLLEPMRELGAGELGVLAGMAAPIESTPPRLGHLRLLKTET